ncbi:MAG: hypothetical protein V1685_06575 [Parcubacteria group bacterium]
MHSQFKIDATFSFLIYNLTQKYENFIQLCREVGMVPIKCIPDVGQYSQLPPFEDRECFSFESPNAHNVIFEVLGHSNVVLQAGVNIYFEKTQTSVYEEVFKQGKKLLDDRFGTGIPEGTTQSPIYNYGDDTLLGYISITMADYVGINLKIGNAKVWNKFYPIK